MRLRKSIFVSVFCGVLFFMPIVAHADIYEESNSNDTIGQAQQIKRDNKTIYQYARGDDSQAYIVNGYMDNQEDVDWYKLELDASKENYIFFSHYNSSKNDSTVEFYDEQGNIITNNRYMALGGGGVKELLSTPYTGTYYVKIASSQWNVKLNYRMSIGEPVCLGKFYAYKFGNITLGPSNPNWSGSADLTNEQLPSKAIVRTVSLMGVSPSAYNSMSFRNQAVSWKNISLNGYDTDCTQQYRLKQKWEIRYVGSSRDRNVTPEIKLYYTFPLTIENSKFWR